MMGGQQLDLWPGWTARAAAIPAVAFALLTPVVHAEGVPDPSVYGLLGIATLPWLLQAAGRKLPAVVFAALTLAPIALINWAGEAFGLQPAHDAQLSLMLVVWLVGCVTATSPWRVSGPITAAALAVPLGRLSLHAFDAWPFWVAGILMAAVTGTMVHRQQELLVELRAAQQALAAEAASQERQRIARELHDVIAHHLTVTMLHLTAARMAVRRDREDAEESLAEAERLGRQALSDVRRTVGLLHDASGAGTTAPLPGAAEVATLIDRYRAAGMAVELHCPLTLDELPPAVGLAVYRAVQEALANAVRHAPGAAVRVALSRRGDDLHVEVSDRGGAPGPSGDGSGLGLVGMRERVEALGGTMTAGPDDAGWRVTCTLPVTGAAL